MCESRNLNHRKCEHRILSKLAFVLIITIMLMKLVVNFACNFPGSHICSCQIIGSEPHKADKITTCK
jgi:hypothetical protein